MRQVSFNPTINATPKRSEDSQYLTSITEQTNRSMGYHTVEHDKRRRVLKPKANLLLKGLKLQNMLMSDCQALPVTRFRPQE